MNPELTALLIAIRQLICVHAVDGYVKTTSGGVNHIWVSFNLYGGGKRKVKLLRLRKPPSKQDRIDFYNELIAIPYRPGIETAVFQELFRMSATTITNDIKRLKTSMGYL